VTRDVLLLIIQGPSASCVPTGNRQDSGNTVVSWTNWDISRCPRGRVGLSQDCSRPPHPEVEICSCASLVCLDGYVSSGPNPVECTAGFSSLTAGGFHTCGLRVNGDAHCWGQNSKGQSSPPSSSVLGSDEYGQASSCEALAEADVRFSGALESLWTLCRAGNFSRERINRSRGTDGYGSGLSRSRKRLCKVGTSAQFG
jgi:hypothetical protein